MTSLLCGSSQIHLGTSMPSGGGYIINAPGRSGADDPGLTTEVELILTVLLGGLAMQRPQLAGGLAVVVTSLLFAKARLHDCVRRAVSTTELNDALILTAATRVRRTLPLALS
jgi:uncharacterized membrane protein (DUF4010 family)